MYVTDRGIEELGDRRGEDQVTLGWLARADGEDGAVNRVSPGSRAGE